MNPLDYGLPGLQALDSPYGLPAQIAMPGPPMLARMPMPRMPPPMGGFGVLQRQAMPIGAAPVGPMMGMRQPGGSEPPRQQYQNVVPFRTPGTPEQTDVPIVGQNVSLQQLTDWQRKAESTGNYQALNRERPGNTASGAYQYTDKTWNNYGGYRKALLAPKAVQDKRFAEDIAKRVTKYNGDLFKAIADHYLPAFANNPSAWSTPQKVKVGRREITVQPVERYVRHVLKGTPYEKQLDAYLNAQR